MCHEKYLYDTLYSSKSPVGNRKKVMYMCNILDIFLVIKDYLSINILKDLS